MRAIYFKELKGFFSGLTGFLVIGLFLLITGLFVFVFEGDFNILDYGFSDLTPFFLIVPWLFIFLIPAITMRALTSERNLGTLELLVTRPIGIRKLLLGKYLAAFTLMILAILPTLIYVYSIGQLGETLNNLDYGSTIGSYIGIIFIALAYTSIGLFSSTITSNQIVSFLVASALSFTLYFGLEAIASIFDGSDFVTSLGLKYHYESMARGVLDTRDIIYFLSVAVFFFALSEISLKSILDKN
ncbi:MAG: gliding motility-associated ABC transporter permease subunit GldF [Nonlabens sp.]